MPYKDLNTEYQNSFCCFVWVWNLISNTKGRTQIEGVCEQGAEENIWNYEGGSGRRLKKSA
jgi:hypothetical protein